MLHQTNKQELSVLFSNILSFFQFPVSALLPPFTLTIYFVISIRLMFAKYVTKKADLHAQGKRSESEYSLFTV